MKPNTPVCKTGASGFPVSSTSFWLLVRFMCEHILVTPLGNRLLLKKGDPGTNGSDLNKDNIIKPTLDRLSKEDHKVLEAYHKEVDEIFLSRYEVTR
jgi:hypothetical protein